MNSILTIGVILAWGLISIGILSTPIIIIVIIIQDLIDRDFGDAILGVLFLMVFGSLSLIIIGSWIQILS